MKETIVDSNIPIGKMARIRDFLPPPEKLVIPDHNVLYKMAPQDQEKSAQSFCRRANFS